MPEELHVGVGWTIETLKIHLETLIAERAEHLRGLVDLHSEMDAEVVAGLRRENDERDQRYAQRFIEQEKALATAFAAQESKVTDAFAAAKEAVQKAEVLTEKRFDTAHTETDIQIGNLGDRVEIQGRRIERLEAQSLGDAAGASRTNGMWIALAGLALSLAAVGSAIIIAVTVR